MTKIKKHLNIDLDFTDDDDYLDSLSDVAASAIERHIDCKLSVIEENGAGCLPAPILHAMLLMIGNLYQNRESISYASASEIPLSYRYLLSTYVNYSKSDNV